MVSARTTGNASQRRSVRQPGSTKSMKIDDTDLDFNFDGYSDHASSRSPSFHNRQVESNFKTYSHRSIVITHALSRSRSESATGRDRRAAEQRRDLDRRECNKSGTKVTGCDWHAAESDECRQSVSRSANVCIFTSLSCSVENRYRQQTASATSSSADSSSLAMDEKIRHRRDITRLTKGGESTLNGQRSTSTALSSTWHGYGAKFLNCFRRTGGNRMKRP